MDFGLAGKKAIVCASSRGLGRGCAMALAEAGCQVVINGRNPETTGATAEEIRERTGVEVTPVVADVSTAEGRDALLSACPDPDVLVNNNGGPPRKDFSELTQADIEAGLQQNMITPLALIQAVCGGMCDRGFGRIINITSASVVMPIPGLDVSSGARAGLTAFLAGVSRTIAHHNVTINNILPGKMDTDRLRAGFKWREEKTGVPAADHAAEEAAAIPAKRFGTTDEFGALCAFLASDRAGYITGQNILMDGGLFNRAF